MQRRPPLHLRVGRISQPASCLTVGKRYTSDVASPSAPASTPPQAQGPRRRAVPVASSLGNISIGNKWSKPTFTKPALKIDPDPAPAPGWTPSTEPPVQGTFASRLAKLAKLDTKPAQSFPKKHSSPPATPKVYKPRAEWENDAQADNGGLEIEWGQHSQAGRGSNRGGRRGQSDVAWQPRSRDRKQTRRAEEDRLGAHSEGLAESYQNDDDAEVPARSRMEIEVTNFEDIFDTPPALSHQGSDKPLLQTSRMEMRARRELEHYGGDYSRYLPRSLTSQVLDRSKVGPVKYAQLALARTKGVGPRQRQTTMRTIQRLVATENEVRV